MINYNILHDSINFYENYGFRRIETPWTVAEAIANITKPEDKINYKIKHTNKVLVASGEQSFLYLYLKEFLPKGKFQTITPCFRDELFDITHTKYFMKNELIITDKVNEDELKRMIDICGEFFGNYLPDVHLVKTECGFDINCGDIEIGSYGIRECSFLKWIYGTGVAEPRFSNLIK